MERDFLQEESFPRNFCYSVTNRKVVYNNLITLQLNTIYRL